MNYRVVTGIVIIALLTGLGLSLYYQGRLTPEPHVLITDVSISVSPDYVRAEERFFGPEKCVGSSIRVGFNLVNSGDIDGFVAVELVAKGKVLDSNQYFVRTNTTETRYLSGNYPECLIEKKYVAVRITEIKGP